MVAFFINILNDENLAVISVETVHEINHSIFLAISTNKPIENTTHFTEIFITFDNVFCQFLRARIRND